MDNVDFTFFGFSLNQFLNMAGNDPFSAMFYVFIHGGWIIFLPALWFMAKYGWLVHVQTKTGMKKEWVLLRIAVPRASEQTVKAVENMFAHFAGLHSPPSWAEKWIQGLTQSPISLEIVSIEGNVGYYIYCERKARDLVEASVYAQYPDAEIDEVHDYTHKVPHHFPDEEWDLFGVELMPVKEDPYPLKTYPEFEDAVSGEFKDPMSAMLENLARLGPGEQVWFQIIITPTDQKEARERAEKLINKLKGIKEEHHTGFLGHLVNIPLMVIQALVQGLLSPGAEPPKKHEKKEKEEFPRMMAMTPGERFVLESIERKAGKVGFMTKMRFIYVGKKTVMKKPRAVHPFIGAIKQVNTFNMQALKPESKYVGVNGTLWWFKDQRNNIRKNHLIHAYMGRSNWQGLDQFFLSNEELATMWHFPILLQVKAPQLRRTEAKRTEPPANIPFA